MAAGSETGRVSPEPASLAWMILTGLWILENETIVKKRNEQVERIKKYLHWFQVK